MGSKNIPRGVFLEAWMQGVKTFYDLRNVMVLCLTYLIGQARLKASPNSREGKFDFNLLIWKWHIDARKEGAHDGHLYKQPNIIWNDTQP